MRYTRILLVIGFLLCGFVSGASAQEALSVFEEEVPAYAMEAAALAAFEKGAQARDAVPFQDDLLAYSLSLPKGWTAANSFGYSLSNDVMVEIGRYTGPVKFNKASSFLTVQAMELDYQTSAKEWFISDVWKNGYSIQGATEHHENFVESLHIKLHRGESYAVRSLVLLNGSRLIKASYYLPIDSWMDERAQQYMVMQSFKLTNVVEANGEPTERYVFYDVASFEYPQSWEMFERGTRNLDQMQASFINFDALRVDGQRRFVNGRVELKIFSQFVAESLAEEMTRHMDGLVESGLVVQRFIDETEPVLVSKDFSDVRVQVYEVLDSKNAGRESELWLVGMSAGDYFYVTSLLTPVKAQQFDVWTRNTQAYKTILGSFEVDAGLVD